MAQFQSPQIAFVENDLSVYAPALSPTVYGLVGTAAKGNLNEVLDITSVNDLLFKLGRPKTNHLMVFAAWQHLKKGRRVKVVRIAETVTTPSSALTLGNATSGGSLTLATAYQYKYTVVYSAGESLPSSAVTATGSQIPNGSNLTIPVTIPAGPTGGLQRKLYRSGDGGTTFNLVTTINHNLSVVYSDTASDASIASAANPPISAAPNVVNASVFVPIDPDTVAAPTAALTAGTATGSGSLTAGVYTYAYTFVYPFGESKLSPTATSTSSGSDTIPLTNIAVGGATVTARRIYRSIAGGSTLKFLTEIADNTTTALSPNDGTADTALGSTGPSTSATVIAPTTALTAGTPTTGGSMGQGVYKYGYTFVYPEGESTLSLVASQTTTSGDKTVPLSVIAVGGSAVIARRIYRTTVGGSTYKLLAEIRNNSTTTFTDNYADSVLGATAPTTGSAAAAFQVKALSPGTEFNGMRARVVAGTTTGRFKLIIIEPVNLNTVEVFDNWVLDSSKSYHISSVVTGSQYIQLAHISSSVVSPTKSSSTTVTAGHQLVNGTNGDSAPAASDFTGGADSTRGLQLFRNTEEIEIDLLAVPGQTGSSILSEMLSVAEARGECLAILDPPQGYTVTQVINWHNDPAGDSSVSLNSSYGSLYYPWLGLDDPYSGTEIAVPPSVFAGAVFANNDYLTAPWFAAAGPNRGKIEGAVGLEKLASGIRRASPDQNSRDLLYGGGNAINPIINIPGEGLQFFGARTLLRATKALDRNNVRRLLAVIKRQGLGILRNIQFEPNDVKTWRRIDGLLDSIMAPIAEGRGVNGPRGTGYQIVCDNTTNTPDIVNQNMVKVLLYVRPTKIVESILVTLLITEQGVSFSEVTS